MVEHYKKSPLSARKWDYRKNEITLAQDLIGVMLDEKKVFVGIFLFDNSQHANVKNFEN